MLRMIKLRHLTELVSKEPKENQEEINELTGMDVNYYRD